MRNPLSWDYLTAPVDQTPIWGPFSVAFVVVFIIGFLISLIMYLGAERRFASDRYLARLVRRGTGIAMPIFGLGLFFFMFRILRISAFGLHVRLWLYLCALAAVAMVGYYVYFVRNKLPKIMEAREAARIKRSYITPSGSRSAGRARATNRPKSAGASRSKKKTTAARRH